MSVRFVGEAREETLPRLEEDSQAFPHRREADEEDPSSPPLTSDHNDNNNISVADRTARRLSHSMMEGIGESMEFSPTQEVSFCMGVSSSEGALEQRADRLSPESSSHHHHHSHHHGAQYRQEDALDDTVASRDSNRSMRKRYQEITESQFTFRRKLGRVIYGTPFFGGEQTAAWIYRWFQVICVLISTVLFVVQTMPEYYSATMEADFDYWYFVSDLVFVIIFSIDFILRIVLATSWSDILSLFTLLDFVSFFGFYVEVIISELAVAPLTNTSGVTMLRLLRLVRILRLVKLSRGEGGVSMLYQVLLKSKDGLFLLVVMCGIATVVFSSILYYIEIVSCEFDETKKLWVHSSGVITPAQSIPGTFWFITEAITTVGYGDEVPISLGGKAWTVLVMLFGVLLLSFPNILIGSNFSEVHKAISRQQARASLGRYFRRVRVVIRFVRLWREFRIKGRLLLTQTATSNREYSQLTDLARKMNFFMARATDFPERSLLKWSSTTTLSLATIVHTNVSLLSIAQRLLECFSGCATVEEITQSFIFFPTPEVQRFPTMDVVFELCLRGTTLNIFSMFVLHREDESALLTLTKRGIDALLVEHESGTCSCMRCYAEARELWAITTKQASYNFLPLDGYRNWQAVQAKMRKRTPMDFVYDLKLPDATLNDIFRGIQEPHGNSTVDRRDENRCLCRYCNVLWGLAAPVRPGGDYCFEPDEELLEMEVEYSKQSLQIKRLENELAKLGVQEVSRGSVSDSVQDVRRMSSVAELRRLSMTGRRRVSIRADSASREIGREE